MSQHNAVAPKVNRTILHEEAMGHLRESWRLLKQAGPRRYEDERSDLLGILGSLARKMPVVKETSL